MAKRSAFILVASCLFFSLFLIADEKIDSDMNWKIRREATENSQIMEIIHQLTDVHGPRLTGSSNFRNGPYHQVGLSVVHNRVSIVIVRSLGGNEDIGRNGQEPITILHQ